MRAEGLAARLILRIDDMNQIDIITEPANRATERRTMLRLRDLCDEVLASYHHARGEDLFSSEDRKSARDLMASVVGAR
ncbi:MAG TPA: hypothetical protein VGM82_13435 [Gemmatimonadaceae bacterium]|jgi:hypothetical protein